MVAKVRNLATNHISPQFHIVFDELFSTIYNDTKLSDTKIEVIFNELFHDCRENFSEDIPVPEGATPTVPVDPRDESPELGDEWLSEPEQREKRERAADRYTCRNKLVKKQNKEFEKLNKGYNPPYPTARPDGDVPSPPRSPTQRVIVMTTTTTQTTDRTGRPHCQQLEDGECNLSTMCMMVHQVLRANRAYPLRLRVTTLPRGRSVYNKILAMARCLYADHEG